ncbi:MAG: hypothetical protein PHG96_10590, partial [Kiritimatiellae bacterium]|nr:hypothetical protein [Kiritimatiellia bacterium]
VVKAEVRHVLSRQGTGLEDKERGPLEAKIGGYLKACWSPEGSGSGGRAEDAGPRTQGPGPERRAQDPGCLRPQDFINLFLAETFINRSRGED